jgi:hypothetical protein
VPSGYSIIPERKPTSNTFGASAFFLSNYISNTREQQRRKKNEKYIERGTAVTNFFFILFNR